MSAADSDQHDDVLQRDGTSLVLIEFEKAKELPAAPELREAMDRHLWSAAWELSIGVSDGRLPLAVFDLRNWSAATLATHRTAFEGKFPGFDFWSYAPSTREPPPVGRANPGSDFMRQLNRFFNPEQAETISLDARIERQSTRGCNVLRSRCTTRCAKVTAPCRISILGVADVARDFEQHFPGFRFPLHAWRLRRELKRLSRSCPRGWPAGRPSESRRWRRPRPRLLAPRAWPLAYAVGDLSTEAD